LVFVGSWGGGHDDRGRGVYVLSSSCRARRETPASRVLASIYQRSRKDLLAPLMLCWASTGARRGRDEEIVDVRLCMSTEGFGRGGAALVSRPSSRSLCSPVLGRVIPDLAVGTHRDVFTCGPLVRSVPFGALINQFRWIMVLAPLPGGGVWLNCYTPQQVATGVVILRPASREGRMP